MNRLQSAVDRIQKPAAHVPTALRLLLIGPMLAIAGYWCFTYSGLYRLLAEWQLRKWNEYSPKHTGAIVVFVCLIPAAVAIQVIGRLRQAERNPADAAATEASYAARSARNSRWIVSHRWRLLGLIVTAGLVGVGVYSTGLGLLAGDRVSVDAGPIERGADPGGRWAEVTGRLRPDDSVGVTRTGDGPYSTVYLPLVSPEWRRGQPVRLYLEMPNTWINLFADDLATGRYEGMLAANALPGVAITELAERGRPAPDRYWVLDYRATPKSKLSLGYAMFVVAGIAGLLTALGWVIAGRRQRA